MKLIQPEKGGGDLNRVNKIQGPYSSRYSESYRTRTSTVVSGLGAYGLVLYLYRTLPYLSSLDWMRVIHGPYE